MALCQDNFDNEKHAFYMIFAVKDVILSIFYYKKSSFSVNSYRYPPIFFIPCI